jgi:uncharacterized membrane protein
MVRRLESFSDIVIGFSLAQTAVNLVLPQRAADFVDKPVGIAAFLITFAVVVRFWLTHSAIFRNFFVPNAVMVFLNFVALALIVLQVYALQLMTHFIGSSNAQVDAAVAARIYSGIFALTFGALALLFALGTYYRWAQLDERLRNRGIARSIQIACVALGAGLGTALASNHLAAVTVRVAQHENVRVLGVPNEIVLGFFGGMIVGWIVSAIAIRIRTRTAVPERAET